MYIPRIERTAPFHNAILSFPFPLSQYAGRGGRGQGSSQTSIQAFRRRIIASAPSPSSDNAAGSGTGVNEA